ncbi:MAG TPA: DUF190 domain-containing protein [Methylovirgula sp.]|nr:DUF190 domain-containing protein [Methylovirgula sp.]
MAQEVTLVRIYLSEAEHGRRKTLVREIMDILHDRHNVKGVTVFRGIAGFGGTREVHPADLLRILADLPIVIEFFDDPPIVDSVLEGLKDLVPSGRIVTWPATRR